MALERFVPGVVPMVRANEREVLRTASGASTGLVVDSDATGGAASVLDISLAMGADGAAPHFHTRSSELFFVVSGQIDFLAGDHVETLTAGDTAIVPPLMHHAFAASAGNEAHLYTVLTPGVQRFGYFRLLDDIFNGRVDRSQLEAAQADYDNWFVDSPVWGEARGLTTRG
ncbi:cupin domain-containing protein [Mycobacterium sp. SMC-11]|uniref:cupin domain-containing protein n=1 Tax=Mycobacterium sp. SMC-11 TaxID=3385969 RepID=UPI00390C5E57